MILDSVEEAVKQGARSEAACERLGVSQRTVQRWQTQPQDARRGPLTTPANKMSEAERQLVISAANCVEFRDVSPKQIVPRLADKGRVPGQRIDLLPGAQQRATHGPPRPRPRRQ